MPEQFSAPAIHVLSQPPRSIYNGETLQATVCEMKSLLMRRGVIVVPQEAIVHEELQPALQGCPPIPSLVKNAAPHIHGTACLISAPKNETSTLCFDGVECARNLLTLMKSKWRQLLEAVLSERDKETGSLDKQLEDMRITLLPKESKRIDDYRLKDKMREIAEILYYTGTKAHPLVYQFLAEWQESVSAKSKVSWKEFGIGMINMDELHGRDVRKGPERPNEQLLLNGHAFLAAT